MENKYLLSICIPTYNRAPYLKKCLDSLICQNEFIQGKVEIVISDNASTDNTEAMVRNYMSKYKDIFYYKNKENIKDKNFPLAFMRANGILRKLSNDTSIFQNESLKILCEAAQKYCDSRPVLFWTNGNLKTLKVGNTKQVDNLNDFLSEVTFLCTWIGAFSLWEEDCMDLTTSLDQCDTHLWQVWMLCNLLQKNRSSVLDGNILVSIQKVNKKDVSYGIFDVFYKNFIGILQEFPREISKRTLFKIEKELLFHFFAFWICQNNKQQEEYRYSEDEKLKSLIFNQYRSKPYFWRFRCKYLKWVIKEKMKNIK